MGTMSDASPIVCPFCSLGCELTIETNLDCSSFASLSDRTTSCTLAKDFWHQAVAPDEPRLVQKRTSVAEAQNYLRRLASSARHARIVTSECDLLTARQLEALTTKPMFDWWVESTPAEQAWHRVTSRDGIVSASLGDIALHADLFWFIGDISSSAPCFESRLSPSVSSAKRFQTPSPM